MLRYMHGIYSSFILSAFETNLHKTKVCSLDFFSVRLLSVLRGHSVFSTPPQRPMTSDFEGFLSQIVSITFYSYPYSERASISQFNVECQKRELLVPFLKHLWYDAVLDWGLNQGPLGYRGGGCSLDTTQRSKLEHQNAGFITNIVYHIS